LFASSKELTPEQLTEHAKEIGLAGEQFSQCLNSGRNQSAVEKDVQEGHRVGVNSTPTMVVNGKLVTGGASLEFFRKLIEEEIGKAKGEQK
jgi:predicted DsbA family dithiol-disulfide isomerase